MDIIKTNLNKSNFDEVPSWPFHINGRDDAVFIHIPKTGGTSIRWSLDFNRVDKTSDLRKHNDVQKIIGLIGREKWDEIFTFAFVRNPWDRLLSHYYFRLRTNKILNPQYKTSFDKWAMTLIERDSSTRRQFNLQPQSHWLMDKDKKIDIDFIGRFERLQEDFIQLTKRLAISAELIHLNQNPIRLDYRHQYNAELKLKVAKFYEEDIDNFGCISK